MNVLVKTDKMSREEWLKWRTKGIGGSDASVIAGVNPYRSVFQLWLEKTGQVIPQEADSEYTHFGNILEPIVKKEFTRRTGIKVRAKKAILQSTEYPFMLADLDGVIYENGEKCIFEAKTASAYKQEVWEDGVPEEYILQVQHYMAVTGCKKAYIAALVGGNHFFYHVIYRDDDLIEKIINMEKDFWENAVLQNIEPAADGSKATTAFFNETYRNCNGNTVTLPEEALSLCNAYDELSVLLNSVQEKKDAISNQLKSYLKDNETGTVGNRTITWKQISKSSLDTKRLKSEHPDIYSNYLTQSSYRRLSVA